MPRARKPAAALSGFHAPLQAWFTASFEAPTQVQELAWPRIQAGESALILAPTGSGKTLAAFLAAIDGLMFSPVPEKLERCRVLYVSPLKALAVDVERNLRAPLVGVSRYAERMGAEFFYPEVAIRTGDTPSRERAQFLRNPSDILITTPESLYLLLTSNARDVLRSVRSVIVDEVHALVGTKRGSHLSLSLERLEEITAHPLQRIGLSATVRPIDEAARFLAGFGDQKDEDGRMKDELPAEDVSNSNSGGGQGPGAGGQRVSSGQWSVVGGQDPPTCPASDDSPQSWGAGGAFAPTDIADQLTKESLSDLSLSSPCSPRRGLQPGTAPRAGARGEPESRPVAIVDAGKRKRLDLRVEVPVEDMARIGQVIEIPSGPAAQAEARTSIWPAIHPLVLQLIREHRSTLIFVNSRRLAERLSNALNELAGEEIVRAHHGSIAREQRLQMEDELKAGRLPAMVATSSLELGIDMGAIDLVIQVEAPPSVASAIQRIGRAGHQIGAPSSGIILPKYRGDLLACAALTERMRDGDVESVRYPRNPLDVLAQQIVAMVGMDEWSVPDLHRVIRRAAPFAELSRALLDSVLDMLSGRYPSDDFAELRPRLTWDRLADTLRSREGARRVAVTNPGTIPDRGLYGVFLTGSENERGRSMRVGELDEEMVFESHAGETFVLGASTWRIEEITHDRVLVSPAPGQPGRMPYWHGDGPGRPLEFGRAIGALSRSLRGLLRHSGAVPTGKGAAPAPVDLAGHAEAIRLLTEKHALTEGAARNLVEYLQDQAEATGVVPDDRTLVVERYLDEMGDWRVCLLSPFGARVHAPWALAISAMLRENSDIEPDILWTDDGIVVRLPEADEPPPVEWMLPDPDEVEELVIRQLGAGGPARQAGLGSPVSAIFAARFREAAARALLLPRRHPGRRAPLWQQRKRAADLFHATSQYGSFPIILETYRECLRDVFDMPALVELLRDIRRRSVRVVPVTTRVASPFASALLFNYVANFMYEGDAPLAERRAQALTLDQSQLRELLGEVELRELLDPDALETLELELQFLTRERKARHPDALHDMLLRLGDLSREEIAQRVQAPADVTSPDAAREVADEWVAELLQERRIITLPVAGEPRFIAAEDTGRYRDALGIPPPLGLPAAFLEFVRDPVGDLVTRYSRTHGPFLTEEVAHRLGVGIGPVLPVLNGLEASGRLVRGEFRPGGSGREWCDAGVLRTLRQRSLARLRHEVEPVEAPALGRLYLAWQSVQSPRKGRESLIETIDQLQGAALPASDLEARILPARVQQYSSHELDELTASGAVIWVGTEPIGEHDGRVSLYLVEHAQLLLPGRGQNENCREPMHEKIRGHLRERGASFFAQIVQACGGGYQQEVQDALWDLVWAGEVTNDTLQPLRAYLNPRRTPRRLTGYGGRGMRTRALFPPEVGGRWSLVSSLLFGASTPTERLAARARQLLDRYGVLTREAVQAEGIEGGFSSIYGVLKAMEDGGQIRRGYFVAGRGATQFALPGAIDRLRSLREPDDEPAAVVLAATDPANPYGAALPWPARDSRGSTEENGAASTPDGGSRRAARAAGAVVVLVDGALAAWMGRRERGLSTFFDQVPDRDRETVAYCVAQALADEVAPGKRRAVFVKEVDGRPAQETSMARALIETGFTFGPHGYMKRL